MNKTDSTQQIIRFNAVYHSNSESRIIDKLLETLALLHYCGLDTLAMVKV